MLALASLATGFVVAAITPSHGAGGEDLDARNTGDALSSLDHTIAEGGPAVGENAPSGTD